MFVCLFVLHLNLSTWNLRHINVDDDDDLFVCFFAFRGWPTSNKLSFYFRLSRQYYLSYGSVTHLKPTLDKLSYNLSFFPDVSPLTRGY